MQEITLENLGSILKKIRKEKCPTQQEVAEGIHVEQSVIYSWERGAGNPYFITIYKLCRSFGMSLDEFLGIEKKKHYTLTIILLSVVSIELSRHSHYTDFSGNLNPFNPVNPVK